MKTTFHAKPNRLLLNATAFVILLPIFASVAIVLGLALGVPVFTGEDFIAAAPRFSFIALWLGIILILAMILVLWKGRMGAALTVLLVGVLPMAFINGGAPATSAKKMTLVFTGHTPVSGVDVYCNGVHLGQTPLKISREDFSGKVQPWTTPPRQERLDIENPSDSDPARYRYSMAKYSSVPQDICEEYDAWPPKYRYQNMDDEEQAREAFLSSRYWWRFEKSGCVGLTSILNFGGSSHGQSNYLAIEANPSIVYPSLQPHLDLLIENLKQNEFQPTQEWVNHFRKYQDLLFTEFYQRWRTDKRLESALETLVRAEFDLPEKPLPEDCERTLNEIMDRAETRGGFLDPSIESAAIDLMGDACNDAVVKLFPAALRYRSGGQGWSSSSEWTFTSRSGKAARRLPLEYAIRRLCPPKLFDLLVYESSRDDRLIGLVANYQRKETVGIVQEYLRGAENAAGNRREGALNEAVRFGASVRNPDLEDLLRDFVRRNGVANNWRHYIPEFTKARIGDPEIDQTELATWIYHWSPLQDREKVRFLTTVDSTSTYHYLQMLEVNRNENLRWEVVSELAGRPNPSLDQFLIDSYEWAKIPNGSGYSSSAVIRALIKTDTPRMREFLSDRWNRGAEEQLDLVRDIARSGILCPQLDWMAPLIKDATDSEFRCEAAAALGKIGTPQASAVLEEWTKDPDVRVKNAATDALAELRRLEEEKNERLKTAVDLIAGQIKPDDLLPAPTPYVWDGKDYVPEEEKSKQSKADPEMGLVRPPNFEPARPFPAIGILL